MSPEEIARIDWKAAANWAQLITDTRNQSANDTAQLRRTQDNLDWISTWWVQAGAASARFARRKQTFQIALDKLTRQLATSPDYLQEAKTILAQTQLPTVTQDLFNTSTARRIRTDGNRARISAAFDLCSNRSRWSALWRDQPNATDHGCAAEPGASAHDTSCDSQPVSF